MIRDDSGQELLYWPFTVEASQDSQTIVIRVDTPGPGQVLGCTVDERATVFAREAGLGGPFTDLSVSPIDLTILAGPYARFEVFVRASADVPAFERVSIYVGARKSSPAAWTA
jgi:hypothetical protein